ncbi:MAG: tripartite tricarboxylate transporter substrate binding protein [Alphaproteobacteria bacterium]|nr:tripartite tricarboxylate transporter substrate binding protein [Alphaproteobacteria bacterium]
MNKFLKLAAGAAALISLPMTAVLSQAADYPSKPITLVAPYGPGGASDLHARIVAGAAPAYLKQAVLVINKTGAAGVVGSTFVAKGKKDGYTLLSARVGSQAGVPAMNPKIPYKWDEFTFLGLTERNPFVLVVKKDSPYKNFKDFEAALKSGTSLSYSSAGVGTLLHLASLVMADKMGVDGSKLTHVPYKGGGKARAALVGGHVDFLWQNLSGVIGAIQSGQAIPLAITTGERFSAVPDVPTVKELGYPEMEAIIGWSGIFGPPGMNKAAADKWIATLAELKTDKAFNKLIKGLGSIPDIRNPEDTKAFVKGQYETFRDVVVKLGIEVK